MGKLPTIIIALALCPRDSSLFSVHIIHVERSYLYIMVKETVAFMEGSKTGVRRGRIGLQASAGIALVLLISVIALTSFHNSSSQGSASSNSLVITVNPDGSVNFSFNVTQSAYATSGTIPTVNLESNSSTSGGVTTLSTGGTFVVPAAELDQAPYNYTTSESLSASGNYSGGVSKGNIIIQAAPAVSSPLTSFNLGYLGNSTALSASGSTTIQFGNYSLGSGSYLEVNQTTIGEYITLAEQEGFNTTYLDSVFSLIPYADLTATSVTITPTYGSSSANVTLLLQVTGNITALPAALAAEYACILTSDLNSTTSTTTISSTTSISSGSGNTTQCYTTSPLMNLLYSQYEGEFTSLSNYSYDLSYASGIFSFEMQSQTSSTNLSSVLGYLYGDTCPESATSNCNITSPEFQYLNSTRVDLSNFQADYSESQLPNGTYTIESSINNILVYPPVVFHGNSFNETELLQGAGTFNGTVTIVGGSSSGNYVFMSLPGSDPQPTSHNVNSSFTWNSVNLGSISDLQFSFGTSCSACNSTSSTTTSSSPPTTSPTIVSSSSSLSSSSSSSTTVTVTANGTSGTPIQLTVVGNISSSQISNASIAEISSNVYSLNFTITGQSGTAGTATITIPKSEVPSGLTPTVYIDGTQAASQSYTQDSNNYYVTFSTHFSTHQVEIRFSVPPPAPAPFPYLEVAVIAVVVIAVVSGGLLFAMRRRSSSSWAPVSSPAPSSA